MNQTNDTTVRECIFCGAAGDDLIYDEFLDAYVCYTCDTKREVGGAMLENAMERWA